MDQDRAANIIDPEDRSTPSTGASETGESGQERAREEEERSRDPHREEQGVVDNQKKHNDGVH